MERYNLYKDSGVEWIGEIPSHWEFKKFKHFISKIIDNRGRTPELVESGIPYIEVKHINGDGYHPNFDTDNFITQNTYDTFLREYLKEGDVLFSTVGSILGKTSIFPPNRKGCIIQNVVGFRFNNLYVPIYMMFQLKTFVDRNHDLLVNNSNFQGSIKVSTFKENLFISPPLSEQQQIVTFLDTKTKLIDSLIEKTQRKIELLKEKRTSLINEVVTKGLNPNVEMKDSGVEWIGEIPSHWLFTKFNRFVFFQEGPGLRTFQFTDEGTKVICVTNITEKGIDFTYKKFISIDEYFEKYQHFTVEKGDYLLSSSGNSWGKVSEYLDDEKVMLNTSTIRLNTLDSSIYNKSLIPHILKSEVVRKQLEILMTGSCQPNFGPSHLNQLVIPIPPLSEQQQIVEYLDEQTGLIDKTISIEEKRIELLKEYRQSLISEVVTGKRKVV